MILFLFNIHFVKAQVNLNSSLTACYALNGNATETINGLNGTLSSVSTTSDRFGNLNSAYAFSGQPNSYIELPNSNLLKANEISFSAWVKFNHLNSAQYIVFTHNGCLNYHEGYMLAVNNWLPGGFQLQMAKADNSCSLPGQATLNGLQILNTNTWYHVGFYIGADSLKLYLNGNLDATMAYSSAILYNPSTSVFLGGSTIPTFNAPLDGNLDNVRFYNRKLSGAEFMELFLQDPFCRPEITGIEQNSYVLNSILIYPNPVEDYLEFRFDKTESKITYTIENYCGQRILNGHYDPSSLSKIDCSQLREGFYVIRIRSGGKETVLKFTKK